jgi:hypothetical protein
VRVWDVTTGRTAAELRGHFLRVWGLAFRRDGARLASASDDQTARVWDLAARRETTRYAGHSAPVWAVAFSPDGARVASTGKDGSIKLWDADNGQELFALDEHPDSVWAVGFAPDGRSIATGSVDGLVRTWRAATDIEASDPTQFHSVECVREELVQGIIEVLFAQLTLKEDVLKALKDSPSLEGPARERALELAGAREDNEYALNTRSWEIVRAAGRTADEYRQGLRFIEAAMRRIEAPDLNFLATLGVAQYRSGQAREAMLTSSRCKGPIEEALKRRQIIASMREKLVAIMAVTAMAHAQLAEGDRARAELEQLRTLIKERRWPEDPRWQAFVREAEAMIK